MNLTDGATIPMALIKYSKNIVNQKEFSVEINQFMQESAINHGWNTQIVQILYEICDGYFIFKGKPPVD